MKKLLLMSIVFATICLPILSARGSSAPRALKKTLLLTFAFVVFYLVAMRFIYPHMSD